MRSSSGQHFIGLDHVRALAAFMVFAWHFLHASDGRPIPFEYTPDLFVFALLDEGHTGVALFMTLSGYLFAKLLEGKRIAFGAFFWNRLLRLAPLLVVVLLAYGLQTHLSGGDVGEFGKLIAKGLVLPTLPGGGWSITVECHFYLLLPLLLWLERRARFGLLSVVVAGICLRWAIHHHLGEVQTAAYWTIVGRIDQFVLGMFAYHARSSVAGRHVLAVFSLVSFAAIYWYFDRMGGFYQGGSDPSPSTAWVFLPTIEGAFYALGTAYYDESFRHSDGPVSRFVGLLGTYSYSIYLLHFFVVFKMARFIDATLFRLSNFYVACACALVCFVAIVPVAHLSYRFVESPFLKLRRRYTLPLERDPA